LHARPAAQFAKKTGFCEVISFTIRVIRSLHFFFIIAPFYVSLIFWKTHAKSRPSACVLPLFSLSLSSSMRKFVSDMLVLDIINTRRAECAAAVP
jgi:hypothetical protein